MQAPQPITRHVATLLRDERPDPTLALLAAPTGEVSIADGFLEMAQQYPMLPAIDEGGIVTTYAALAESSARLARHFVRTGLAPGAVIGIHAGRGAMLIVTLLAAVRAGLGFVILDRCYPVQRLRQQAELIRADAICGVDVAPAQLQEIYGAAAGCFLSVTSQSLRDLPPAEVGLAMPVPAPIAYLLFTSGTTGAPKCIKTGHAPLRHFLQFYLRAFGPAPGARFSMLSGLGHDPLLRDVFAPLSCGAQICIPDVEVLRDPVRLYAWLAQQRVTHVHATPQMLKLICAGQKRAATLQHLKYFFSGGDVLLDSHVAAFRKLAPSATLVNFYGATETPQAMGYHVVAAGPPPPRIPIGRGIDDVQLLILTEALTLAPIGEHGQIAIRTRFLSNGYVGDAGTGAQKFIRSPFTDDPDDLADLLYLSGDVGYYLEDGSVAGVGRADDQVKIRGFRVELQDVTAALERTGCVTNAATLAYPASNSENMLVAYVVAPAARASALAIADDAGRSEHLRAALAALLPAYMVPAQILWVERIALLPNGKVDRAWLSAQRSLQATREGASGASGNDTLDRLALAWCDILSRPALDVEHSFVELGGDSLSYIQASLAVEETLGWLPPDWEKMPLGALAALTPRRPGALVQVGMTVVARAVSIFLIVLGHFKMFEAAQGPTVTMALFIIAGWSFGKHQFPAVLRRHSLAPLQASFASIAIPTMLCVLLIQMKHSSFHWQSLLLVSNLVQANFDNGLQYWFIEVLLQIFAINALLLWMRPLRTRLAAHPFAVALALASVTFVLGRWSEDLWNTEALLHRTPQFYLWTLYFGMALAYAESARAKTLCSVVAAAAIGWQVISVYAGIVTLLILWTPRLRLPKFVATPIRFLAMASMFIYLTNFQFLSVLERTPLKASLPLVFLCALGGGVLIWKAWELGQAAVRRQAAAPYRRFRRVLQRATGVE